MHHLLFVVQCLYLLDFYFSRCLVFYACLPLLFVEKDC